MKYSFERGLLKGLTTIVVFAIPVFLTNFPEIAQLTIGGLLIMLVNYLKVTLGKN
jgi:hypothetical protein